MSQNNKKNPIALSHNRKENAAPRQLPDPIMLSKEIFQELIAGLPRLPLSVINQQEINQFNNYTAQFAEKYHIIQSQQLSDFLKEYSYDIQTYKDSEENRRIARSRLMKRRLTTIVCLSLFVVTAVFFPPLGIATTVLEVLAGVASLVAGLIGGQTLREQMGSKEALSDAERTLASQGENLLEKLNTTLNTVPEQDKQQTTKALARLAKQLNNVKNVIKSNQSQQIIADEWEKIREAYAELSKCINKHPTLSNDQEAKHAQEQLRSTLMSLKGLIETRKPVAPEEFNKALDKALKAAETAKTAIIPKELRDQASELRLHTKTTHTTQIGKSTTVPVPNKDDGGIGMV